METNVIIETKEYEEDPKFNLTKSNSIDTFDNIQNNNKKYSSPTLKVRRNNQNSFLNVEVLNKDMINDIESTGNNSEKNTNKGLNIIVTENVLNNKISPQLLNLPVSQFNLFLNKLFKKNNYLLKKIFLVKFFYEKCLHSLRIIIQKLKIFNEKRYLLLRNKKRRKQRFSFADNVQLIKAKMKLSYDNQNNNNNDNLKIAEINSEKKLRKIKGIKQSII